jgi:4'-phosphopantetheinyl transferase EntD
MAAKKSSLKFFYPKTHSQPNFHPNHLNKARKPEINRKSKIFSSSDLLFRHFQYKIKHQWNFSHRMEPLDIKIDCFGG